MILAEDEAGLYLQATMTRVWAPRGRPPRVSVHPGRERTCFYGTLNLCTGQQTVQESRTWNALATAQHLGQILDAYPGVPILLLWDRAPWHQGEAIRAVLAAHPRLEVLVFPTASPELNPQEHVWKATRAAVSHNHPRRALTDLAQRFAQHLRQKAFPSNFLHRYGFAGFQAVRPTSN